MGGGQQQDMAPAHPPGQEADLQRRAAVGVPLGDAHGQPTGGQQVVLHLEAGAVGQVPGQRRHGRQQVIGHRLRAGGDELAQVAVQVPDVDAHGRAVRLGGVQVVLVAGRAGFGVPGRGDGHDRGDDLRHVVARLVDDRPGGFQVALAGPEHLARLLVPVAQVAQRRVPLGGQRIAVALAAQVAEALPVDRQPVHDLILQVVALLDHVAGAVDGVLLRRDGIQHVEVLRAALAGDDQAHQGLGGLLVGVEQRAMRHLADDPLRQHDARAGVAWAGECHGYGLQFRPEGGRVTRSSTPGQMPICFQV